MTKDEVPLQVGMPASGDVVFEAGLNLHNDVLTSSAIGASPLFQFKTNTLVLFSCQLAGFEAGWQYECLEKEWLQ